MSAGGVLKVNPDVLRNVGTAFGQAGDRLAGINADAPLGDAASAVPQLQTAVACGKAASDVAAEMIEIAAGARKYSENLNSAAHQYQTRDEASAAAIRKIKFPQQSAEGSARA
jgi:Excreted virulence factor EspC, type VII ESX diderm